jgi:hypothetical protein
MFENQMQVDKRALVLQSNAGGQDSSRGKKRAHVWQSNAVGQDSSRGKKRAHVLQLNTKEGVCMAI